LIWNSRLETSILVDEQRYMNLNFK
jgi:hypothetical protein